MTLKGVDQAVIPVGIGGAFGILDGADLGIRLVALVGLVVGGDEGESGSYKIVSIRLRMAEFEAFFRQADALGLTSNLALRIAARRIGGFSGTGGAQVYVFARMRDSSVKQVFMQGAYGIEMRLTGQSSEFLLRVGGSLCGQSGDHGHGDSIYCNRPLAWDPSAQKMDFASLSEAKFPSNDAVGK